VVLTPLLLGTATTTAATTAPVVSPVADPGVHPAADRTVGAHHLPRIAVRWASAWNNGQGQRLARLFTVDARYTDQAFGATFTGRDGVATWVGITQDSIENARVDLGSAFRAGNRVAIQWTFSGTLVGAPSAFALPAATVLRLHKGKIASNDGYYNLADLLQQSGLSADTDPTAPTAPTA
jgi:steroid delta-isomerase-like uncharacterized protein